ncbi:glycosyltransferase family 4 protein [Agrococcus sediminis]|uniref:D-inositol 3-phosphate glycosyltransferase n=1 Tax=Agrococcus sediminis TaxID=2599924 RepID=A0A5M8QBW4_9MICO|nr:glycosyltransferase family 4 protein [Agrococcus sediminis]KAA6431972.1 glycosyltransferase family 4 protein [Agrococcus sediminis]
MRILLLSHYFEPEDGAPQRRWHALLQRFVQAGHEVHVICPPPHHPTGRMAARHRKTAGKYRYRATEYGANIYRVSYLWHNGHIATRTLDHLWVAFASMRAAFALRLIRGFRPDVVIATAPGLPTLLAGHSVARLLRAPLVAEMRDAWPDLVSYTPGLVRGQGFIGRFKHLVHEKVTSLQQTAAHVVTTTSGFAEVLRLRGIERVTVIRNGTLLRQYEALPPRESDHPELRVLYIGTIGRSQGLDVLLRAASRLREAGLPASVRIVGSGADIPRLRRLNAQLGHPVELMPQVPASAVFDHYLWADTCVVSLRDWEPFSWTVPSKLYELMAAGRHISALVAGESADLVIETASGDVVSPGDDESLARLWTELIRDPSRLQRDGGGRAWIAEHVDFDRIAEQYLDLLDSVSERAAAY